MRPKGLSLCNLKNVGSIIQEKGLESSRPMLVYYYCIRTPYFAVLIDFDVSTEKASSKITGILSTWTGSSNPVSNICPRIGALDFYSCN